MTVPMVHIFRFVACVLVALTLVAAQDIKRSRTSASAAWCLRRLTIPRNRGATTTSTLPRRKKTTAYNQCRPDKAFWPGEAYVEGRAGEPPGARYHWLEVINCLKTCETGFGCPKLGTATILLWSARNVNG